MKDVIVTGGRDYDDYCTLSNVLALFDIGLLIQGGASGADWLARTYASENNIKYVTVDADWEKHGRAAGPIRNKEMVTRYPNAVVIAFPGGRGTANCINEALAAGLTVLEVKQK